jgi:hypothetical protein
VRRYWFLSWVNEGLWSDKRNSKRSQGAKRLSFIQSRRTELAPRQGIRRQGETKRSEGRNRDPRVPIGAPYSNVIPRPRTRFLNLKRNPLACRAGPQQKNSLQTGYEQSLVICKRLVASYFSAPGTNCLGLMHSHSSDKRGQQAWEINTGRHRLPYMDSSNHDKT